MRAVVMQEFGPPEVLEPAEVAEPEASPGEVIIEAEFANVTFVETQIRAGRAPHPSMLPALPVILGNGTGGTVAGRRVVALAGQPGKLALARDLGADYSSGDWPGQVRAAAGQVDVVFDGVGGDVGRAAFGLLGAGGRFYPFGMASGSFAPVTPELAREHGVTVLRGGPADAEESAELSRTALAEAAAGRLRPVIGQEFDLARASAAHAAIEARATIGKTLLTVPR